MTGLRRFPTIKRCGEGMASALEFAFAFHDWALVNTISIIGALPMTLVFFFFQKYMVKGLVAGAVKG